MKIQTLIERITNLDFQLKILFIAGLIIVGYFFFKNDTLETKAILNKNIKTWKLALVIFIFFALSLFIANFLNLITTKTSIVFINLLFLIILYVFIVK